MTHIKAATSRMRLVLATLLAGLLTAAVLTGPAASAHGGDLRVDVGTDGAGGIDALIFWANDDHPVEESVAITVTATSEAGEEIGPVTLRSSPQGVGWYVSESGLLGEGHWSLTTVITEPAEYEGTVELDIAAPVAPPAAEDTAGGEDAEAAAEDEAAGNETADGEEPAADGNGAADGEQSEASADDDAVSATEADGGISPVVWVLIVAALVVAAIAVVIARRRARQS
ncbi:hypothetical protein [Serinibacter salmoneus]|uniref:CopC domain-containing protein n=1 Tax=Serinibacter salmoneus TaxID=556530 RepID=A0A2A9CY04_9MICO|nr:hypothetical protein [Serinibacter salmoneus]PFG18490.1 hypothetical protein ATL40_0026 [Serinibacter salmoneus]